MKGDFSRFDFAPNRSFSRVLIQQGRMSLDADANEQQHLNLLALRSLAADLIGRHGGAGDAFKITEEPSGAPTHLAIGKGRYYVDGWMATNEASVGYIKVAGKIAGQPFYPTTENPATGTYLAYLEVWERSVIAAELDPLGLANAPEALREVALGGPDTAARAQLVWQVKLHEIGDFLDGTGNLDQAKLDDIDAIIRPPSRGKLSAEAAKPPVESDNPCDVPPRSRYRGVENQLYRIEIAVGGKTAVEGGAATFVWSRENCAVALPVDHVTGTEVKLADVWRDARFKIGIRDIVEIVSDASGLGEKASFHLVNDYDPDNAILTLDTPPIAQSGGPSRPLVVRRWDHGRKRKSGDGSPKMTNNMLQIEEGQPLTIEEGITVEFEKPAAGNPANIYRAGDYWLIPARSALGDILWPKADDKPVKLPPHGIERHLAPLAQIAIVAGGPPAVAKDLRKVIKTLVDPA